ncbi:ParB N-terminal domain-containing protein [Micrococcus luteus]|nr:ParB N-terminal domain-containing protein [Micrococcus luteus]
MVNFSEKTVPLVDLLLDPNNFRFNEPGNRRVVPESRFSEASVQEAIRTKIVADGLAELKNSIAENGFIPVERIVVRPWVPDDSKFVVVEGNRRTAALKLLSEDYLAGVEVGDDLVHIFDAVPVLLADDASEADYMAIMGIRHVGGPKAWGGYQSAELIAKLLDEEDANAVDVANKVGLTPREVNRRYRAFGALRQMMNDEEVGDLVSTEMYPIFHEVVAQPDTRQWLGWNEGTRTFDNVENRAIFYQWLAPGEGQSAKITRHSDVRDLRKILGNAQALSILKDPNSSLGEAMGVVVADARATEWVAKLQAADEALDSMGAATVEQLTDDQVALLQKVNRSISRAVAMHRAFNLALTDEN